MRRVIAVLIIISLLFNGVLSHTVIYAKGTNNYLITIDDISKGKIVSAVEKNGIVYKDISLDGIMVYTSTYNNGRFEYAYSIDETTYYYMYVNGELIRERQTEAHINRMSDSDYIAIAKILEDERSSYSEIQNKVSMITNGRYEVKNINGAICVIQSMPSRTTTLNVGITDLTSVYPAQYQAYSSAYGFYCSYLGINKNVTIRDTRNNYVETSSRYSYLSIGLTVAEIAATIWMSQGNVLDIFSAFLSFGELIESLDTNRGITARSSRVRQGFIYDTTYVNGNVSVHSDYGNDYYTVSNQGSGYNWGEVPYTVKDYFPDSYVGQQSANAYNSCLNTYGYWKWGNV